MNEERKNKLLKYFFPTEKARHFLCNDLYVELSSIVPQKICISPKNLKNETRKQNYYLVKEKIAKFLDENETYKDEIREIFNLDDPDQVVEFALISFVFIKLFDDGTINGFDLFSDKVSICYCPVSFLDLL